eukprot:SAG22_NODE_4737_length_1178_cov_3.665431_2_plen_80_part_00
MEALSAICATPAEGGDSPAVGAIKTATSELGGAIDAAAAELESDHDADVVVAFCSWCGASGAKHELIARNIIRRSTFGT